MAARAGSRRLDECATSPRRALRRRRLRDRARLAQVPRTDDPWRAHDRNGPREVPPGRDQPPIDRHDPPAASERLPVSMERQVTRFGTHVLLRYSDRIEAHSRGNREWNTRDAAG